MHEGVKRGAWWSVVYEVRIRRDVVKDEMNCSVVWDLRPFNNDPIFWVGQPLSIPKKQNLTISDTKRVNIIGVDVAIVAGWIITNLRGRFPSDGLIHENNPLSNKWWSSRPRLRSSFPNNQACDMFIWRQEAPTKFWNKVFRINRLTQGRREQTVR